MIKAPPREQWMHLLATEDTPEEVVDAIVRGAIELEQSWRPDSPTEEAEAFARKVLTTAVRHPHLRLGTIRRHSRASWLVDLGKNMMVPFWSVADMDALIEPAVGACIFEISRDLGNAPSFSVLGEVYGARAKSWHEATGAHPLLAIVEGMINEGDPLYVSDEGLPLGYVDDAGEFAEAFLDAENPEGDVSIRLLYCVDTFDRELTPSHLAFFDGLARHVAARDFPDRYDLRGPRAYHTEIARAVFAIGE